MADQMKGSALKKNQGLSCHLCGYVHVMCSGLPSAKKRTRDFICKKCQASQTGLNQGMDSLKTDTGYENDVWNDLTQGKQVLSITSPSLEPSTLMSKDETFYRRNDEIYKKAVFWKWNSFGLSHGNAVKHFVQEAD